MITPSCRTPTAGRKLDVEGSDAQTDFVPLAPTRSLRILGDHRDRFFDERRVSPALQSSELLGSLS
jgi:hypothetical protein